MTTERLTNPIWVSLPKHYLRILANIFNVCSTIRKKILIPRLQKKVVYQI